MPVLTTDKIMNFFKLLYVTTIYFIFLLTAACDQTGAELTASERDLIHQSTARKFNAMMKGSATIGATPLRPGLLYEVTISADSPKSETINWRRTIQIVECEQGLCNRVAGENIPLREIRQSDGQLQGYQIRFDGVTLITYWNGFGSYSDFTQRDRMGVWTQEQYPFPFASQMYDYMLDLLRSSYNDVGGARQVGNFTENLNSMADILSGLKP